MLLPTIFFALLGSLVAIPQEDFRSNLEFFDYASNVEDPAYRLTDAVYPHTMDVNLDVYLSESRFTGIVTLGIEVKEAGLTQIVFHQNVVSIENVDFLASNGNAVSILNFTTDPYYELLLINLVAPLNVGNYSVIVRYTGVINENPLDRGFYKGYYFFNNAEVAYATTQFQPFHARKAFPCFDEPKFKSRFVISITRDSNLGRSYSNMEIADGYPVGTNRFREVFYPTPIISAYLVAFHVSDFVATQSSGTAIRPFQIISRRGVTDQHEYAAQIGLEITNQLDDFMGIQYHEMGQGVIMKNDHIALPDFPSGAMENWGMVNYREAYLLYDGNNTNILNKIFIATIMAHELGHKWFGNLVTNFWWSNLWLNESFASFFEYFAAHWADPSLELDDQFVVDYVHSALNADASSGATSMNWTTVSNNPSISSHFSTTSYAKGASVLKMMEHFVGFRNFRAALRYYLRDQAYGIGYPSDMYDAFQRAVLEDRTFIDEYSGVDIGTVFDSWVQNRGSPIVTVNVNTATGAMTVRQQRYQLSGNRPATIWQIPLTWTHQNAIDFTNTKPRRILTTETTTIEGPAGDNWVIFNVAQSGLYRVNYDEENWRKIGAYLRSNNRNNVHKLNRAQIANDLLYYIRSGDLNQTVAFEVLEFLKGETDYYVWNGAITQLEFIRRRFEHLPYAKLIFTRYILELLEPVIQHLGYNERPDDSTSTILNRMQIMNWACNLGHEGCIADSLNKWRAFRGTPSTPVPVNLRRYVYCVGLREGNAEDYNFLFQQYESSENTADMVVILRALACTKIETSFNHYLRQSIENRRIRIHDRTNAASFAIQGNDENQELFLTFLYQNYAEIRTAYGGPDRLTIVINAIPGFLTDFAVIQQFQDWVYRNQIGLGVSFNAGVNAVNVAIENLQWGNENAPEIYDFILARSSSTTFVASTILVLAALFVQLFR